MVASSKTKKNEKHNVTKTRWVIFWHPFLNQILNHGWKLSNSHTFLGGVQGHPSTPLLQQWKAPVTGVHVP